MTAIERTTISSIGASELTVALATGITLFVVGVLGYCTVIKMPPAAYWSLMLTGPALIFAANLLSGCCNTSAEESKTSKKSEKREQNYRAERTADILNFTEKECRLTERIMSSLEDCERRLEKLISSSHDPEAYKAFRRRLELAKRELLEFEAQKASSLEQVRHDSPDFQSTYNGAIASMKDSNKVRRKFFELVDEIHAYAKSENNERKRST